VHAGHPWPCCRRFSPTGSAVPSRGRGARSALKEACKDRICVRNFFSKKEPVGWGPVRRVRECAVFDRNALKIANTEPHSGGCHSFLLLAGLGSRGGYSRPLRYAIDRNTGSFACPSFHTPANTSPVKVFPSITKPCMLGDVLTEVNVVGFANELRHCRN
jgi:hypothetical protein